MADYARLLNVALGNEPADLVIRNGILVNVLTRQVYKATLGICEDTIAYVTHPGDEKCVAREEIDASGKWLCPGLIDSHMHVESTHVTAPYFAQAVLPHGITSVAQDPHEMANVMGVKGVEYMRQAGRGLPLRIFTLVPTCVPAVPGLETSGAEFGAAEVEALLDDPATLGLAEVMDYWGVIRQSRRISEIVQAGRRRGVLLTGHIRGLGGRELNTYLAAGINSDHELLTAEGIMERARLGMTVEICCAQHRDNVDAVGTHFLRHGNLENIVFVTDDVPPHELVRHGHLDWGVRKAISLGIDAEEAIRAATLNPARRLRLHNLGCIAPGKLADILILSSLDHFEIHSVVANGCLVVEAGKTLFPLSGEHQAPQDMLNSVHLPRLGTQDFELHWGNAQVEAAVLTRRGRGMETRTLEVHQACIDWQGSADLAQVSIWHRHGRNEHHFATLLAGSGLKRGALASTYSHDSHNLVVVGRNPEDMALAANTLTACGGGYTAVSGGQVLALAAMPVGGILAEKPVEELARDFEAFQAAAAELGVMENPIGLLTSLPLPVVPAYRPTDMGLVDVQKQAFIPAWR